MCSDPITRDGNTFACRSCNQCIATRRHNWVARAMMEKSLHPHCLIVALTYDDTTEENRDAAAMFQYLDVRHFMGRLRAAIRYAGGTGGVRFICAGEQGDRNGRCHWHMVLYSSFDLTTLGEVVGLVSGKRQTITKRENMISVGKRKRRLNWSLWPHGYVTMQEPDQGGMSYVLSYCLKDQFTVQKSQNTARHAKAENFATGLFRMSKRPAIGEPWLWSKFETLEQKGAVLPSLNMKIPGLHGFYHPSGSFREKILWTLVALNKRIVWASGGHAPQWPSLLASLQDNPPDLEILNGPQKIDLDNAQSFESELAAKQRQTTGEQARYNFARTCGNALPCDNCLGALSDDLLTSLGVQRWTESDGLVTSTHHGALKGFEPVKHRQRQFLGRSNPYCARRGSQISRNTFPDSDRTNLGRGNL